MLIEYYDHNETFASVLPVYRAVQSNPVAKDSALRWFLVNLGAAITYQGRDYRRLLIASRLQGYELNEREAVSVFTLLVPASQSMKDGFSYKDFLHVAWCMATVVEP